MVSFFLLVTFIFIILKNVTSLLNPVTSQVAFIYLILVFYMFRKKFCRFCYYDKKNLNLSVYSHKDCGWYRKKIPFFALSLLQYNNGSGIHIPILTESHLTTDTLMRIAWHFLLISLLIRFSFTIPGYILLSFRLSWHPFRKIRIWFDAWRRNSFCVTE